CQQYNNLPLTC
nr:immunoglobulin light chain junction region [Macaca mulatta]